MAEGKRKRWVPSPRTAAVAIGALTASLMHGQPARAVGEDGWPELPKPVLTQVSEVKPDAGLPDAEPGNPDEVAGTVPDAAWPQGGSATVNLDTAGRRPNKVTVGGLPLELSAAADRSAAPKRVRIEVLDQASTPDDHVGVFLRLTREDGQPTPGAVRVTIDYKAFADAVGANWASNLELVDLPGCQLAEEPAEDCADGTWLETDNNTRGRRISTVVPVQPPTAAAMPLTGGRSLPAGSAAVVALVAGPSGPSGSSAATPLSPAGSWSAGGNSGAFDWTYPLDTPPALSGPEPGLSLAYSSARIDGQTGSTNNQPSWAGQGFDLENHYIERSYRPCQNDGEDTKNKEKFDLCWPDKGHHLTVAFDGHNGELVADSGNTWRLRNDDGTTVTRITGDRDGNSEYFVLTTTDGTRYYFGRGKRFAGDSADTQSAWKVPVYGNHAGEPCNKQVDGKTDFAKSACDQVWRWNLDYVVDASGNTMTYFYQPEGNRYGANRDTRNASYHRGGYLQRIEYGQREGKEAEPAPAKVTFKTVPRCVGDATACDRSKISKGNAKHWQDVPLSTVCTSTKKCKHKWSPSFFTLERLQNVTTEVRQPDGKYRPVDRWDLAHKFESPGDGSTPELLLQSVTHTGLNGGEAKTPPTMFTYTKLANRYSTGGVNDPELPYLKARVHGIQTESGGLTNVIYKTQTCNTGVKPEDNTTLCFPSNWSRRNEVKEKADWFHKYIVTEVNENPRLGAGGNTLTSYDYGDNKAAWHYDDTSLAKTKLKTWNQFRGFAKVTTTVGDPKGKHTKTVDTYLRGMSNDRNGPAVEVTTSDGTVKVNDHDRLAGHHLEHQVINTDDGVENSAEVNVPKVSDATAVDDILKRSAYRAHVVDTRTRTRLASGGHRHTQVINTYDDLGRLKTSNNLGEVDKPQRNDDNSTDDSCTTYDYATNTSKNLINLVQRTRVVAKPCTAAPNLGRDLVSETVTVFRGQGVTVDANGTPTITGAPADEAPTYTYEADKADGGNIRYVRTQTLEFDAYGRETKETDALGRHSTTTYTPATGGPVTEVTTSTPLGNAQLPDVKDLVEVSVLDPGRGSVVKARQGSSDKDRKVTATETVYRYDPLGRLSKVWEPRSDHQTPNTDHTPNLEYRYHLSDTGENHVATIRLTANGSTVTTYEVFDGQLRNIQSQGPDGRGGRTLTNIILDSRGLPTTRYDGYQATGEPDGKYTAPKDGQAQVPATTVTTYDGVGRPISQEHRSFGTKKWTTTTQHNGDHTITTPPPGGTPTVVHTNIKNQPTKIREYKTATPTGDDFVETTYGYDHADRLNKVTKAGATWSYHYDLRGRLTHSTDPDAGNTTTKYDDEDNPREIVRPDGTITIDYDQHDRRTKIRRGNDTLAEWAYDTAPNGIGEIASSTSHDNGRAYTNQVEAYYPNGDPKTIATTIPDTEDKRLAGTYRSTATYHADGAINTVTIPKAGNLNEETITHTYDSFGRPTTTYGRLDGKTYWYTADTAYDPYGDPWQTRLRLTDSSPRTAIDYTYHQHTRKLHTTTVQRIDQPNKVTDVALTYDYDPAGNLTRIADTPTGNPHDVQCFTYNHLRQLTEAWAQQTPDCAEKPTEAALGGPAPYWQSFRYNDLGNRTSLTEHTPNTTPRTTIYQPATNTQPHHAIAGTKTTVDNKVTENKYDYDTSGRTTRRTLGDHTDQTLTYNPLGRLAKITEKTGKNSSYTYTGDGQLLITRDETTATTTLHLPDGQQITVNNNKPENPATTDRYYTHNDETIAIRNGDKVTWHINDHHDTRSTLIGAQDNRLIQERTKPFGEQRGTPTPDIPGNRGFVGGITNKTTGLTHVGAREYDPTLGRFTTPDPLIDHQNPDTLNSYTYAFNNPTTHSDPTGLAVPVIIGIGLLARLAIAAAARAAAQRAAQEAIRRAIAAAARRAAAAAAALARRIAAAAAAAAKRAAQARAQQALRKAQQQAKAAKGQTRAQNREAAKPAKPTAPRSSQTPKQSSSQRSSSSSGKVKQETSKQREPKRAPNREEGAEDAKPSIESGNPKKAKGDEVTLYRAVKNDELAEIASTRAFSNPAGIESKYFSYTEEGAAAYARQAFKSFPEEGAYTIVRTTIARSAIPKDAVLPHLADARGLGGVALPTILLSRLGRARIMPWASTGG